MSRSRHASCESKDCRPPSREHEAHIRPRGRTHPPRLSGRRRSPARVRPGRVAAGRPRRLRRRVHRPRREDPAGAEPAQLRTGDHQHDDARAAKVHPHRRSAAAEVPLGPLPAGREAGHVHLQGHGDALPARQRDRDHAGAFGGGRGVVDAGRSDAVPARLHARLPLLAGVRGPVPQRAVRAVPVHLRLRHDDATRRSTTGWASTPAGSSSTSSPRRLPTTRARSTSSPTTSTSPT